MSQEARNIMQDLRNRAGTQTHKWNRFRAATTLAYIGAYTDHKGAVDKVHKNMQLEAEAIATIFGLFWSLLSKTAPGVVPARFQLWAGRLIAAKNDIVESGKKLAGDMFEYSWDTMSDTMKKAAKDTAFSIMSIASDPERPYEVVSDDPYTYEKKLELMLERVTIETLGALDELVTRASGSWSVAEANQFVLSFESTSPYFNDVPDVDSKSFGPNARTAAELCMWMQWALAYEPKQRDTHYMAANRARIFDPVLDRLYALGVPLREVTFTGRVGGTVYNRSAQVLDRILMASWARRNMPMPAAKQKALVEALGRVLRVPAKDCRCSRPGVPEY